MSIRPLPASCHIQLSSGQSLVDPCSVVKELIDNAIDAFATSISIEISSDTIDTIQVRDNGGGINPDDRGLIGRRFCTSKLTDLGHLARIGGTSLGFRGEAISSMLTMAERVEITTMIEGEAVAVKLTLMNDSSKNKYSTCSMAIDCENANRPSFPFARQQLISHPRGTTVRVVGLFHTCPVRRQSSLKDAPKVISKITRLIHSYILSRPAIRVCFKVTKAKTEKANFIYAPATIVSGNIQDAVRKLIARECAAQCTLTTRTIGHFTFEAFHPSLASDPSAVSGHGHFLSVDSRPVSTARGGTLRSIYKAFTTSIRAHHTSFSHVKDPFLRLNIACPPNSYDANVEPQKDDLLFVDAKEIISSAEQFFSQIYLVQQDSSRTIHMGPGRAPDTANQGPDRQFGEMRPTASRLAVRVRESSPVGPEMLPLLASSSPQPCAVGDCPSSLPSYPIGMLSSDGLDEGPSSATINSSGIMANMYDCDDEDWENIPLVGSEEGRRNEHAELETGGLDVVGLSNPWIRAKMATRISTGQPLRDRVSTVPQPMNNFPQSSSAGSLMEPRRHRVPRPEPVHDADEPPNPEPPLGHGPQRRTEAGRAKKKARPCDGNRARRAQRMPADPEQSPGTPMYPALSPPPNNHDIRAMLPRRIPGHLDEQSQGRRNLGPGGLLENLSTRLTIPAGSTPVSDQTRRHEAPSFVPDIEQSATISRPTTSASELRDIEDFFSQQENSSPVAPARRRTKRQSSIRRSRLPRRALSYVPDGQETNNLVLQVSSSSSEIITMGQKFKIGNSLVPWAPATVIHSQHDLLLLSSAMSAQWGHVLSGLVQRVNPSMRAADNLAQALREALLRPPGHFDLE
jgi:DNA mismatch repair protein MutL